MKNLDGVPRMIVALLYGAGLRLQECLELRVKDIDLERGQIVIRRGKGQKDRPTVLPTAVIEPLSRHLDAVKRQHLGDLARGLGRVVLPFALDRKYPNAASEWGWQFVFPASRVCTDPRWGPPTRFHLHESVVQKAVAEAARQVDITKRVSPHTFRHSFANTFARGWLRHSDGAGAARTQRRIDDDDLYARAESRRTRRCQPA